MPPSGFLAYLLGGNGCVTLKDVECEAICCDRPSSSVIIVWPVLGVIRFRDALRYQMC